ncbi:hypothetical protein D3C80_1505500 [compost metagenome]
MSYAYTRIWNQHGYLRSHLLNSLYPIVKIIDLATAGHFALNRFSDKSLAVLNHISLNRKTILRRRFNNGQIPYSEHGHMQRPRNWRRRQGKNVYVSLQLL